MKDEYKTKKQLIDELTELRSQNAALKKLKSVKKYRSLVETIRDVIYELDSQGLVLYISPIIRDLLGFDSAEIVEKNFIQHAHKDDLRCLTEWFSELRKGREFPFEYKVVNKSGALRWARTRTRPIMEDGLFKDAHGILIDVTGQRRKEEALRESNEGYRAMLERNTQGILVTDIETRRFLYANPSICRMLGYSDGELLQLGLADIHPKDSLDEMISKIESQIQGKKPIISAIPCLRKDGTVFYSDIAGSNTIINGRECSVGFFLDVTERKQAEEKLKESEARFRDLAELLPEIVFEIDQRGLLTFANQNAFKSLGYTPKDFASGLNVLDTVAPEDQDRVLENIQRALNGGDIGSKECLMRRKDGSVFPALFYSTAIVRDGKSVGLRGFAVDITLHKRAEEELKRRLEKLHKTMGGIIQAMALTVETRDPTTAGHQRRVADLARSIGQEMGLTKDQVESVRMAGTVHDLGKISVPAEILNKQTKLSEQEFGQIKGHPQTSYDILKDIEFPWPIARIVSQHHERINCSGYPFGLKDEEILLEAKVLMVADVVEAIAFHRPYRVDYGIDLALDEIYKNKGILYDAEVVDACLRLFREKGFKFIL